MTFNQGVSSGEPPGFEPGVSLAQRLSIVRRRLDLLAAARLSKPLDPETEQTYQDLCDQEQEILKAMEPSGPAA
jgi:hypothetical protein